MPVDAKLMEILVCPKCKGKITEVKTQNGEGLKCDACKLVYPVKDDIPVMLIDEAAKL
jgi:uncharacterized protein YbaR (Trm112 family)